ncbi:MAG: chromosomal replication initiator protein DnaA [Oligoflexia bacterium]|nr:chromosomal replication initiator protein DnaA [Oligoflexia bacterium]
MDDKTTHSKNFPFTHFMDLNAPQIEEELLITASKNQKERPPKTSISTSPPPPSPTPTPTTPTPLTQTPTLSIVTQNTNDTAEAVIATAKKSKKEAPFGRFNSVKEARFSIDLNGPPTPFPGINTPTAKELLSQVDSTVITKLEKSHERHHLNPEKNFDTFVVGPSNRVAFATCQNFAKNPTKSYSLLYIHSRTGLGKTHLIHSIANYLKEAYPQYRVIIVTARDFMRELVDYREKIHEFRKKYMNQVDILMIEDIQELKDRPGTQAEIFHLMNEFQSKNKQLILTADRPPNEIVGIGENIKNRILCALVIDIKPPELETRLTYLKNKTEQEDFFLPDDVIREVANNFTGNIRELESALVRLGVFSSVMKEDIDLNIAKEQLKIQMGTANTSILTIEKIVFAVSRYYKIPVADIRSKSRSKKNIEPRHVSIYLIHKLMQITVTQIAQFFYRDHTTVIHALQKMEHQIKEDRDLSQTVGIIEKTI